MLPRLLQLLGHDSCPRLQFEACWATTNIASGTYANKASVIAAGALPHLVRLLDSPDGDVLEQAVWALGNIAGDSVATRQMVLAAGVIPPLLRRLTPRAKLTFARKAAWTISNLVRAKAVEGVIQPRMDAVRPLLPRLAALISSDDKEVLADALWALSYLSDGEEDRLQSVLEAGCLPRVVALLAHPNPDVVTPALRTVGNLVTGDDLTTQAVLNEGLLQSVVGLFKSARKGVRKEVCWLVSNVCSGTQTQLQAVLDAGIVPLLASQAVQGDWEVVSEACWALANAATTGSRLQVHGLVEGGAIAALSHALQRNVRVDTRVLGVAIEGLESILRVEPPSERQLPRQHYAALMEAAGVPQSLRLVHKKSDNPSHGAAAQRLLASPHFAHLRGDAEEKSSEEGSEED